MIKQQGIIFQAHSDKPEVIRNILRFRERTQRSAETYFTVGIGLFVVALLAIQPLFLKRVSASDKLQASLASTASASAVQEISTPTPTVEPTAIPSPTITPEPTKAPIKSLLKIVPVAQADSNTTVSFISPLSRVLAITTYFSWYHPGVDLAINSGTPVFAAADGTVVEAGWSSVGYGNTILLQHADNSTSRYAHLSVIDVSLGQTVYRGQTIGNVGCTGNCTGPHLHFEIHRNGTAVNPLNLISL